MPLAPGVRLGSYEVTAKIGQGGMGEVWQATDTKLNRQVALSGGYNGGPSAIHSVQVGISPVASGRCYSPQEASQMRRVLLLVVSLAFVAACDSDSPTAPSSMPSRAAITVSVSPNPGAAGPSSDPNFEFEVEFAVAVRETAGLGANVDFINLESGEVSINIGASEIIDIAGTNQISGRGSLAVPLIFFYTSIAGGPEIDVTVEVQCTRREGKRHHSRNRLERRVERRLS